MPRLFSITLVEALLGASFEGRFHRETHLLALSYPIVYFDNYRAVPYLPFDKALLSRVSLTI